MKSCAAMSSKQELKYIWKCENCGSKHKKIGRKIRKPKMCKCGCKEFI
ncbi:hypothetical protein [Clostridium perfringens]|nr:hypothetical protein [Clostridium perfringens]